MLGNFHNNIEALKRAPSDVLTNSPKQKHNVPGWNKDVREKHEAARQAYLYWIDNHKPKSGPLFDIMEESKKEFKYALRACRKSQQKCKADAMAEALQNRSPKKFWQSIRKSKKSWLLSAVGGETGNKAVTVMWRKHFSALLNSSKNCGIGNFVQQYIISHGKIKSLLHKLPLNRSSGKDGIFVEHIFYADSSVCNHLSSLFNVCLMHGKIPQECMKTVIVPNCKNKNGNVSDAGNYRPVSLATIISKLFEHYILLCISPLLATTDNQSLASSQNMALICVFFYLYKLCLIM